MSLENKPGKKQLSEQKTAFLKKEPKPDEDGAKKTLTDEENTYNAIVPHDNGNIDDSYGPEDYA